jgi:hypothetical protein
MKHINLKPGETIEINLPEFTITHPRLRQITLSLTVMANGEVCIGTVFCKSKIESARIYCGQALIKPVFTEVSQ